MDLWDKLRKTLKQTGKVGRRGFFPNSPERKAWEAAAALRAEKAALLREKDPDILLSAAEDPGKPAETRSAACQRLESVCRPESGAALSETQRIRCRNAVIREQDPSVWIPYGLLAPSDLEMIFRCAFLDDLRVKNLSQAIAEDGFRKDKLKEALLTVDSRRGHISGKGTLWFWVRVRMDIEKCILEQDDPKFLLSFVTDPEIGDQTAAECLGKIFGRRFDEFADIGELRDRGITAYLEMGRDQTQLPDTIPAEMRENTGANSPEK